MILNDLSFNIGVFLYLQDIQWNIITFFSGNRKLNLAFVIRENQIRLANILYILIHPFSTTIRSCRLQFSFILITPGHCIIAYTYLSSDPTGKNIKFISFALI